MRRFSLMVAAMLVTALTSLAHAQTSLEDLDRLFGQLQRKDIGAEALNVEREIWNVWMHGGTTEQNKALETASGMMGIGSYKLAEAALNDLIGTTQTFSEAYNKRATLYFLMGRYDESLADIVKTLELEPRHFGALSGRGMILSRQGKQREALHAYREALRMNPHLTGVALAVQQLEKFEPEL
jgi:tetratricopeptide (TPR) repeat protein